MGYIQRRRNSSLAELIGFYLSESPEPERPFTAASLAALILASGMKGCFNDLPNGRPVTLYMWTTDSDVSRLLGFLHSQRCQASGTGQKLRVYFL